MINLAGVTEIETEDCNCILIDTPIEKQSEFENALAAIVNNALQNGVPKEQIAHSVEERLAELGIDDCIGNADGFVPLKNEDLK